MDRLPDELLQICLESQHAVRALYSMALVSSRFRNIIFHRHRTLECTGARVTDDVVSTVMQRFEGVLHVTFSSCYFSDAGLLNVSRCIVLSSLNPWFTGGSCPTFAPTSSPFEHVRDHWAWRVCLRGALPRSHPACPVFVRARRQPLPGASPLPPPR